MLIGLTIFIIFAAATVFFALRSSVGRPVGVNTHEAEAWLDTFSVRAYQPSCGWLREATAVIFGRSGIVRKQNAIGARSVLCFVVISAASRAIFKSFIR